MKRKTAATILCIEDEKDLLEELTGELTDLGYVAFGARNAREAGGILEECHPDIILCDILMPGLNGFKFLKSVRRQHHELDDTAFIFLTALGDHDNQVLGRKSGADDYLVKPVDIELLDAAICARLDCLARLQARKSRLREGADGLVHLSSRETEVLTELGRGKTIRQAAAHLGLSEYTVGDYVKAIYRKLGISSRAEAALEAFRRGLG
ncbi:response regulator transcription factor [Paracoccus methylarcula]|uniref:DNA-binding response regulator n=1 Tax=Paracoccus methylarcula TaxID=72022 RepID=A0A3R7LH86_9RHOB|nr:response regulator [Paracoccus methylarcula]RNF33906.1 DNA-binding response regulator [Paracoccus methylarcula]